MKEETAIETIQSETENRIFNKYEKTISGLWEKIDWPNILVISILEGKGLCGKIKKKKIGEVMVEKLNPLIQKVYWNQSSRNRKKPKQITIELLKATDKEENLKSN